MAYPRSRLLLPVLVLTAAAGVYAQGPFQTREPPYADGTRPAHARGRFDPDEPVRQAQHTVPGTLPTELLTTPGVVPIQYTQVVGPAGELPTPVVTLHIEGTEATPTGQPVIYKLHVRNQSRAKAHNVVVRVTPPKNVTPVKLDPPPTEEGAETRWVLKTLEPGEARTIELVYRAGKDADEVKLLARVQFDFGRGMITRVAPPTLSVKRDGPEKLVVGETGSFRITVKNTGQVTVRDIEVLELLNPGGVYADRELARGAVDGRLMSSTDTKDGRRTWTIPALAPGQTQVLDYRIKARDASGIRGTVHVKAGDLIEKAEGATVAMTASLQLKATGPQAERVTVGQPAMYKVVVENKGNVELRNVVIQSTFPPDMRVTKATNGARGFRDRAQWVVKELKPGEMKELNVGLTTGSPGKRAVQFSARANHGAEQTDRVAVEFVGVSDLDWDLQGPGVEAVGKAFTYRVVVSNRGSAPGTARVQVDLPESLAFEDSTPPAGQGFGQNAKEVRFGEITIPPGKKTTYVIMVKARTAGEARTIFRLVENGRPDPKLGDRVTNVVPSDTRSPAGPPPRDPSRDG